MPTLQDVWNEIAATDDDWLASIPDGDDTKVPADSTAQFVANGTQRDLIQQMGTAYGCHTCNRKVADTNQLYIVDHIPPRGLFQHVSLASATVDYRFYAHCDRCALEQAQLVRIVRVGNKKAMLAIAEWRGKGKARLDKCRIALAEAGLTPKEIRLLTGGKGYNFPGHGAMPRRYDRTYLNQRANHCHSCGSRQANFLYHADHCPPKEFAMSGWFKGFLANAADPDGLREDIAEALEESYFRPQCPYCSHRQGGRVNKIVITATKEVVATGMTTKSRRGRTIKVQKYR